MKHFLIIFIFIYSGLFGQTKKDTLTKDLKEIITYHTDTKQIKEKYTVLKSDNKTKHGYYISFFKDNFKRPNGNADLIFEKGEYTYGMRTGKWEIYKMNKCGNNCESYGIEHMKGEYKNNKKAGIWEIVKEEGQITEHFDFDNNKIIDVKFNESFHTTSGDGSKEIIVEYQLDSTCTLTKISILKGFFPEANNECLKIIKDKYRLLNKYGIKGDKCDGKIYTQIFKY